MKNVTILDCTLRDGSYVNRFQFSAYDTKYLCKKLQAAGVQLIEVGHGLGLGASRKGGEFTALATDEEYLAAAAEVVNEAKFGMFCIPGIATLDDIDLAHKYGMDFIRIGANVTEAEVTKAYIEKAKAYGMTVCVNFMKSYALPPAEFSEKAVLANEYGADVIYIVDSAGGMLPSELADYIKAVQDKVDITLGFHGHNNMGLASALSLDAVNLGVNYIDTSLQGLGRSAGNTPTEQFVLLMNRIGVETGIDQYKVMDLGFDTIQPLLPQAGQNPIDLIAGYSLFHSSYIPVIRKCSTHYCVDPRELIVELCKRDQINAPEELVDEIARSLKPKDEETFYAKYHLERYYVNEQK